MSDQVTVIDNLFIYIPAGMFDVSCNMFSNLISLVSSVSDTDSESVSLIWLFVADG